MPGARRLLVYSGVAVATLAVTVFVAVLYAMWQIDETAIEAETVRARVALVVTARDVKGSEERLASTLANAFALKDAHFGEAADVAEGEVTLAVPGQPTRLLIWTPRRFGTELFMQLAPIRIAASVVFIIGISILMWRLYLLARELEERRREAHQLASHDVLTGLGNRLGFEQGMARLLAGSKGELALFYLDLDGFKQVNDTFGHGAGDELLRAVGERLRTVARDGDTLARIGGDEFALVRGTPGDTAQLVEVARDIEMALSEPMRCGEQTIEMRASIGIAVAPADGTTAPALLEAADAALYRAKRDRIGYALATAA